MSKSKPVEPVVSAEEIARLAKGKPVGEKKKPEPVNEAKLYNKKYYRTINIDLTEEDLEKNEKKSKAKKEEKADKQALKTTEDYKIILRGMGFKID